MLAQAEKLRQEVASATPRSHKSALGQFMTPATVARFMAGLFVPDGEPMRLLDPGAGLGALSCAVLDRWERGELASSGPALVRAHELDPRLRDYLAPALEAYARRASVDVRVCSGDYLEYAVNALQFGGGRFTHAIVNPPYKKIASDSSARLLCRQIGLETVNLYAAFVGLALEQLAPRGQLVAIIPRSFCNGPYYRPFRDFVLARAALCRLHLFDARNKAFQDDEVLQENVIVHLTRGVEQGSVLVSASVDDSFAEMRCREVPFAQIVKPGDPERFIHIVTSGQDDPLANGSDICHSLAELEITVSTGPVVDFRLRDSLAPMPVEGTVPLLYPAHFAGTSTTWPIDGLKKPNAIFRNDETERWLMPAGIYTVVRRFSSKEERRRVVASVVDPDALGGPCAIGFENHLNVFHRNRQGLPEALAWGLFVYLNSTAVDEHFRRFNGHTQVNATDLRAIPYPSIATLSSLGEWAMRSGNIDQHEIDHRLGELLA